MRHLRFILLLCSAPVFAGTGHIYNLSDGGITIVKYSRWHGDHGPATATMPSGEKLKGEYSVTRGGSASWGSIYASVYGPGGSATATGSGSGLAVSIRGQGTLILTGEHDRNPVTTKHENGRELRDNGIPLASKDGGPFLVRGWGRFSTRLLVESGWKTFSAKGEPPCDEAITLSVPKDKPTPGD